MELEGRGIVVTGASRGLGREIARACFRAGADLLICSRDADAVEEAAEVIEGDRCRPGQKLLRTAADVSDPADVERLVGRAADELPSFVGLVNNAGVYGPKGPIDEIDWDAWGTAIQVNLFGTVLMVRAALPHFRRAGYGKILNLSGGGATSPLPNLSAYAASKAAVVRFTETVAGEVPEGIDINALAPGALNTGMLREVLDAGPEKVGADFYERALRQQESGGTPLEKGASFSVWALSARSDGITGRLLSAVWDPWERLDEHREEIMESDIYTLRRIVPSERGKGWG